MYTAPRGTTDVLPADQAMWRHVRTTADRLAEQYGYQPIDTPMFEDVGVFERGIGEGTDVVEKEMFLLQPHREESRRFALRPEPTAGLCRAYLERGMASLPSPVRLYWCGPAFRHERPQAGRLRQFHQIDLEAIGSDDPALDAEIIVYAWRLYETLGLRTLTLLINSIGDREARAPYLAALKEYFQPYLDQLEPDDQMRFAKNPLRMLDSKSPRTRELLERAPDLHESLPPSARDHFERLQAYLTAAGVPYTIDSRLVRGFDYYTHTVFEIVPPNAGRMGTIGGGGRYDGLIELLGGKPTPAVGLGTGIERIILNLKAAGIEAPALPVPEVFIAVGSLAAGATAFALADRLRGEGRAVQLAAGGHSLKSQLRLAGRIGVRWVVILGDDEIAQDQVTLRDMQAQDQATFARAELVARLGAAG